MGWLAQKFSSFGSINLASVIVLIGTCLVAVMVTFIGQAQDRSLRGLWRHFLPPTTLTHRSARADIIFWLTKHLLKSLWVFPVIFSGASIGSFLHAILASQLAITHPLAEVNGWWLVGFTLFMILANDFSYYLYHRAQHSNAILWEFHKVHHSAERMVGTTDGRVHPLDDLLYYVWNGLFTGVFFGLWMFVIADPVILVMLGLNALVWTHFLSFGFVKHLPYGMSFGPFNWLLVSPQHHHLHHSVDPVHYNRNYSIVLIIWDRMLGTVCDPKPGETFVFGLANNEAAEYHSLWNLYTLPLIRISGMIKQRALGWAHSILRGVLIRPQ